MFTTRVLITTEKAHNIILRALECVSGHSNIKDDIAVIVADNEMYNDFVTTCRNRGVKFHADGTLTGFDIIAA